MELKELEQLDKKGLKTNFSTQKKHLQQVEKIINLITTDTGFSSILPVGYNLCSNRGNYTQGR